MLHGYRLLVVSALCVSAIFLSMSVAWGQVEARIDMDTAVVETGQDFTVHLRVAGAVPDSVHWGAWQSLIPVENVLSQTEWQQQEGTWIKTVRLIAFDSAYLQLPPLPIATKTGQMVSTNGLTISVVPTPSPDEVGHAAEIKDIWRAPKPWIDATLLRLLFIAAFVIALLVVAVWYFRRPRNAVRTRVLEPTAYELALRKLAALEQKQLWQQGLLTPYYTELSYIIREYLKAWSGQPLLEADTTSILEWYRKQLGATEQLPMLQELLQWSDLAKYAQVAPPDTYHPAGGQRVRSLVEALHAQPLAHARNEATT